MARYDILKDRAGTVFAETQIRELRNVYDRTAREMSRILMSATSTDFARWRANEILKQVRTEMDMLDAYAGTWAGSAAKREYIRGTTLARDRMKLLKVPAGPLNMGNVLNRSALDALSDSIAVDLLRANDSWRGRATQFIRQTQQRVIQDREITKRIATGVAAGETRKRTSDSLYREFRRQLGDEEFIRINGRNYNPKYYSELVARTRTREAATEGAINAGIQWGVDLCQVSTHLHDDRPGDICPEFAGRIFSISGTSDDFPPLTVQPPFHPNCGHELHPITEQALRSRDLYDPMSKLSRTRDVPISSFDDLKDWLDKSKPKPKAPKPRPKPKAKPKPKPKKPKVEPEKPKVRTGGTKWIPAQSTKDARAQLNTMFEAAAADPRYPEYTAFTQKGAESRPVIRFQGDRKPHMFEPGKRVSRIGEPYDLPTVNRVGEIMAELDDEARRLGIPPMRGLRFSKRLGRNVVANMGDGIMKISGASFRRDMDAGSLTKDMLKDMVKAQKKEYKQKIAYLEKTLERLRESGADYETRKDLLTALGRAKADLDRVSRPGYRSVSNFKLGDTKGRPYVSSEYWYGQDKIRSNMYHEFGHHVHNMIGVKEQHQYLAPELEGRLNLRWASKRADSIAKNQIATDYSLTHPHEWFAENYSLAKMGRWDLVDPNIRDIVEEFVPVPK